MTFYLIFAVVTVVLMLGGLFFMAVAAVGLIRMPDFYNRAHAATKGVTLGITLLLLGGAVSLSLLQDANLSNILTKIALVIMFQFVANPVGAHLLAKAAHLDGVKHWEHTLSDELPHPRQPRHEQPHE